ncbi:MAG: glycerol-3-phosphate 1-O-acyltransferase PlsY [Candidatus Saganbacteria bacterium]|nr:glycerol-3-phosphate 1-O-acyltransferase PlsY [Candidatus Saganbacteria bacterium]
MQVFLVIIAAYFLGSIPFGYLIARVWNIDIRRHGSGNVGATNVLRTLGPVPGLIVFCLDLLKGALPVWAVLYFTSEPWLILLAGIMAVIGHTYSIFLKFKGGRGAATGLGVLLGVAPDIFLCALIVVILIIALTRYVSLASILTPPLVSIAFLALKRPLPYAIVAWLITVIIIIKHTPNIKRLLNGTERKIGAKE